MKSLMIIIIMVIIKKRQVVHYMSTFNRNFSAYNVFICSCHPWLPSWKKQAKGVNLLIELHMFTHCRLLRNSQLQQVYFYLFIIFIKNWNLFLPCNHHIFGKQENPGIEVNFFSQIAFVNNKTVYLSKCVINKLECFVKTWTQLAALCVVF